MKGEGKKSKNVLKKKSLRKITECQSYSTETSQELVVTKPKENPYYRQILRLKKTIQNWDHLFNTKNNKEDRMNDWIRIEVLGEPLLEKFAWAIPDQIALNICRKFPSIIEIGAGKGYWAHLMQQQGIDISPYDIAPPAAGQGWTKVKHGDPSILLTKRKKFAPNSALFLCYPDEGASMGIECLSNILDSTTDSEDPFCQYIIHVGELIHTGCASGSPQAPWGRSSSPDFQVKLSEFYHCILVHPLLSFPFSRDFLTVWKRTVTINMKEEEPQQEQEDQDGEAEEPEGNGEGEREGDEGEGNEDDDDEWADIPTSERLFNQSQTIATPAYAHLLE